MVVVPLRVNDGLRAVTRPHLFDAGEAFLVVVVFHHDGGVSELCDGCLQG